MMAKMKCDQDLRQKWRSLLREKEGLESLLTLPLKNLLKKNLLLNVCLSQHSELTVSLVYHKCY